MPPLSSRPDASALFSTPFHRPPVTAGWDSDLPTFQGTPVSVIQGALEDFVHAVSDEQRAAWGASIPLLQREAGELLGRRPEAREYGAILEYRLFYDERRADALVLAGGAVVVLELKGKARPTQADLDQAAAYARDLRAYHRECHGREVQAILVPTHGKDTVTEVDGVLVVSPDELDEVVERLATGNGLSLAEFLDPEAYSPLPSLIEAARELFESRTLREVWRASAATDPAVDVVSEIAHEAARSRTRHLVLVTGVPGAGKTLVGMRAVHARYLDDLAVPRDGGGASVPGLYLTGNGPLAEVLQYELRRAGGGGRTFVRHIKSYLDRYVSRPELVPPEHLLVFDEAQRAFSPEMVADKHPKWKLDWIASEPELFVRVCERMPEWSVLVGLIGTGQEIHLGEEEGIEQWRKALERSPEGASWTVHAPATLEEAFAGSDITTRWHPELNLDTEIRFHASTRLHEMVERLLSDPDPREASRVAESVVAPFGKAVDGLRLYVTRDLDVAKRYLRDRYAEFPEARYGILASSRDRDLQRFGIANDYMSTKNVRIGAWFAEPEDDPRSCRRLEAAVTEFNCQGLELDMALVAWGTDLIRDGERWSSSRARRYSPRGRAVPRDPHRMRLNAYRVLLTRGRDGAVVFVPPIEELDATARFLEAAGFRTL